MTSERLDSLQNWALSLDRSHLMMGIVNVTPDSFSDGGKYNSTSLAVNHALKLINDGADILDIGGESTRPNADPVSVKVELKRTIPVIEAIRKKSDILISIDTTKAEVARQALIAGANIVNDISGLTFDPGMVDIISKSDAFVIIMHIKGQPKTMQNNPKYENIMNEINSFLKKQVEVAIAGGIHKNNIILDPGIGFGKSVQDNFTLLGQLNKICELGLPVLVGPSRKSFIGDALGLPPNEREEGTAAAVTAAIFNGARILRVHDVKAMKRVAIISEKIVEAA